MASATTTEFLGTRSHVEAPPFRLIESRGLIARLGEELALAWHEFSRDPQGFIRAIVSAETKDLERRRRLYFGFACGLLTLGALVAAIVILGWHRILAHTDDEASKSVVTMIDPRSKAPEAPNAGPKTNAPRGDGKGGGGGGQESPTPATKGPPPLMVPRPPIVQLNQQPTPTPPLLAVPQTIVGPESLPPPPDIPVGVPNGKPGDASTGKGSGGAIGEGTGTGVGSGTGPGAGSGRGGGTGGGTPGSPTGAGEMSAFDFNRPPPGYVPFSWIYRARAIVTPEADANKIIGIVLVKATFNADGTITDIKVVMPVEYMTESAVESLKRSKFHPATVNGKPVTVRDVPIKVFVHY